MKTITIEKVSLSDMQNLRTVFNPFTADNKYSLLNRGNLLQHFQMELSQKQKIFCQFFLHFINSDSNINIFKKMSLIADEFLKLRTLKNVVKYMSKKSRFRGPFEN